MNRSLLLTLVLFLLFAGLIPAQITVTASSIAPSGTSWTYHATAGPEFINLPPGGANQTWAIPTYSFGYHYETEFIAPSGTPYDTAFPTATNCVHTIVGSAGTWAYFSTSGNEFRQLGVGQNISGSPIWHYDPTSLIMPLPLSYPHSPWNRVFQYEYQVIPGFIAGVRDSSIIEVDGWGTLTTQYGTFHALRTRERHWITEYLNGTQTGVKKNVSYAWFDEKGVTLLSYTNQSDSLSFSTAMIVEAELTPVTSVGQVKNQPVSFSLEQNYPNPFNPTTKISFSVPETSPVKLAVYDILGKETAILVDEEKSAGSYTVDFTADNIPSGIYFYTLKSAGTSITKKMLLLK